MSDHADLTAHSSAGQEADSSVLPAGGQGSGPQPAAAAAPARLMVAVCDLAAHPGNVREDLELTPEFCASIASAGVRVPLLITTTAEGTYRVIEGHRRLAAAVKTGLAEVPCDLDPGRASDEAGQYLDMLLANADAYRRNFAPVEEAAALFAAHEAGASRTRLRKTTGRKAEEIKTALQAGQLSAQTRDAAGELTRELDLEDLALLAEFNDDPGAVSQLLDARRRGYPMEYVAERIRRDRAEAVEHQRLVDELRAAGFQVTDEVPAGGMRLSQLQHDGEDLTPESHAGCPGRGVFFQHWNLLAPVHYCTSPQENGHTLISQPATQRPAGAGTAGDAGGPEAAGPAVPPAEEPPSHARRLVIEGNKAWDAAGQVRKRWLADTLFARRSAPREVAQFVARQLLTMPEPLRTSLTIAPGRTTFSEITRQNAGAWLEICDTAPVARLPLLMLAPIAVTYEYAMSEGLGRATWRTDHTYSPCPRTHAGHYLAFLASLGYQLTPIEQAVAEGVPYTGDDPDNQLPAEDSSASSGEEPGPAEAASEATAGEIGDCGPDGHGATPAASGEAGAEDTTQADSAEPGPGETRQADAGDGVSQAAA
jgi:ParB/Sulfiredoxin domain